MYPLVHICLSPQTLLPSHKAHFPFGFHVTCVSLCLYLLIVYKWEKICRYFTSSPTLPPTVPHFLSLFSPFIAPPPAVYVTWVFESRSWIWRKEGCSSSSFWIWLVSLDMKISPVSSAFLKMAWFCSFVWLAPTSLCPHHFIYPSSLLMCIQACPRSWLLWSMQQQTLHTWLLAAKHCQGSWATVSGYI